MPSTADTLRRTPLYDRHERAGAKLVPFAGWEMPVQYEGIRQEHVNVRTAAGMFDVSHMGEIETSGPQAEEFLQRILSNDVTRIAERGAQYSVLCREDGGVLDDLFTYRLGPERYLTVTNAANHEKDLAWFERQASGFDVDVHDAHSDWAMLAVQGPRARAALERLADGELPRRMRTVELRLAGAEMLVCGTGYTGEDGCELMLAPGDAGAASGTPCSPRASSPPAWGRATRFGSRSASTSTATTWTSSTIRSRQGSAGAASSRPDSSARTPCPAHPRSRRSSRSPSPAQASRARATRSAPRPATGS